MSAKLTIRQKIALVKRALKGEKVSILSKQAGISRTYFYRFIKKYKQQIEKELQKPQLRPQDRLEIIERVQAGVEVQRVCQIYGISRTIFYKWLKRYNLAPEGQKLEALWDQQPKIDRYFRQAAQEYEEAVLAAVRYYPELSSHKLVWVLPQIGGRPILGNHGVQNVLRRYNLNTYEQRLIYSQAYHQPTFATRFFEVFRTILTAISSQEAGKRGVLVKTIFSISLGLFSGLILFGSKGLIDLIFGAPTFAYSIGLMFGLIALTFGMFFFIYSLKYYITIAIVLSFSRREVNRESNIQSYKGGGGLIPNLANIHLDRQPFVSIHLATYNERRVIDRLLTAATSQEYENYEVILVDDSTDETLEILKKWHNHPRIKIVHRETRAGFKGGALQEALKVTNPKAEFIIVFDADFIPYPDIITSFLKYFQATAGGLDFRKDSNVIPVIPANAGIQLNTKAGDDNKGSNIAAVQGYQWHVLNKSENWVTRGVRVEYAGSYVIERSGIEIYQGLKQIAGSVYMIRKDVLQSLGWGTSITEDYELTLRLYAQGYKVVYTPYVQAPSECVSTIRRLIRQRMRWAEGHSHNTKAMFFKLIFSKKLSPAEKLEFLYLSPYYLQAAFLIVGTLSWFLAEVVFQARLPFWTEVWGWSLILTNFFALPLLNMVGLFLEESDQKDYLGLFSFVALSYIVAPFQGYAAVKGFLSKEEGPWFRTPKTGKITDIFIPGRFYRFIFGVFGKEALPATNIAESAPISANPYISLSSANNQFNSFSIRPKRSFIGNFVFSLFIFLTIFLIGFSPLIPIAQTQKAQAFGGFISTDNTKNIDSRNQEDGQITTPKAVHLQTIDGKTLEFIFHKEPRVRIKLDQKEIEITTLEIPGLGKANPKKSLIYGSKKVVYEEIFPNIDLEYQISGGNLKEHFIIKKRVDISEVIQRVHLTDLNVLSNGKTFGFYDREGNAIYALKEPYMYEKKDPKNFKNYDIGMVLEKAVTGYTLKKSLQPEGKVWLLDPKREFPVILDPGVIVSTGIISDEVRFGGSQKKLYYHAAFNKYYALENDGIKVLYHYCDADVNNCSSGSSSWSAAVDLDTDADNNNPSLWFDATLGVIWVAWGDNSLDAIQFRSITPVNGQVADTLGSSICATGDILAANGSFGADASVGITIAGNGTSGAVWASNETDNNQVQTFTVPAASCATNPTFSTPTGTPGYTVPAATSGGWVASPNDGASNTITMVWQDSAASTGLQANELTGTAWGTEFTIENVEDESLSITKDSNHDIWILSALFTDGTRANLYKCATQCDANVDVTIQSDPWTGQSGLDEGTITYASTPNDLILSVVKGPTGSTQKAWFKRWDIATTSIEDGFTASSDGFDYGWAAGSLDWISSMYSLADPTRAGVVLGVAGTSFEFATVPEKSLILLILAPFLPGAFKRLRKRRSKW